jgi:predicted HAD superfamily phosphohydrolase YqeG
LIKSLVTDLDNTLVIQVLEYNMSAFNIKFKGVKDATIIAINVTACV